MSSQFLIQNGLRNEGQLKSQAINSVKSTESFYCSSNSSRDHKRAIFEEDYVHLGSKTVQSGDNQVSFSFNRYPQAESNASYTNPQFRQLNESTMRSCEANEFDIKKPPSNRGENYPSLDNIIKVIDPQALKKETLQSNGSEQSEILSPKIVSGHHKNEPVSANSNTTKDNSGSYTSITTDPVFKVEKKPIIVMKIDLGGGRRDEISLFEGDDPAKVALDFCLKNQLENRVLEPLTRNIIFQLGNYHKQRDERMRQRSSSRGPPLVTNSNFNDSSFNQSTSRTLTDKDESDDMIQRVSNRQANENRSSVGFESKLGGERAKVRPPSIKFELNSGKSQKNESPQPQKEVRRELFKEGEKKNQGHRFAVVHEENPGTDSPLLRKKGFREGPADQKALSYNDWGQVDNRHSSHLRNSDQSTDSLSLQQQNNDKIRSISSKSFDGSKKGKKINKWITDVSRSQNFDDNEDDYVEKVNTKSILYEGLRVKSRSQRDLREEKENSIRANIERPAEDHKTKQNNSKVQSSASKLKAQLLFANVTVVSPTNKLKGNLSVRNINLSTRHDSSNNLKSVRQSTGGTFKFKDSYFDSKPSHNASVNLKLREKSIDEPENTQYFVNKSINLRSSRNLKENLGAKVTDAQQKQQQNGCEMSSDTGRKVSLREAILNRTRSEKSLYKKKAQELEDKVIRQVFRTLDRYKKGVITAETVDISTVDSKILELISEVLFAMEDEESSLNVEQFHQQLTQKNLIEDLMKLVPITKEDDNAYGPVKRSKDIKPKPALLQKKTLREISTLGKCCKNNSILRASSGINCLAQQIN